MKVAIVHYWAVSMRGGEKILEAVCELYPDADLFTHVHREARLSPAIRRHRIRNTFISRLPWGRAHYQAYLPLMPLALEQLDLTAYDLVISIESGPAKGVIPSPTATHVCICCSPMRYVWDLHHEYLRRLPAIARLLAAPMLHYLRIWDVTTASRVDRFVAISRHVQNRIRKYYGRDSSVVVPPVDTDAFDVGDARGDFYLVAGQLVGYKRADLAIEACNRLGRRLLVIGEGGEFKRLARMAGPTVTMLGWQPFDAMREKMRTCRALLFPGEEDFGIVPVEAMASGRPVIAYGRGGATETVIDGRTGVLFDEQTADGCVQAILRFERSEQDFDPAAIRRHAKGFSRDVFAKAIQGEIDAALKDRSTGSR